MASLRAFVPGVAAFAADHICRRVVAVECCAHSRRSSSSGHRSAYSGCVGDRGGAAGPAGVDRVPAADGGVRPGLGEPQLVAGFVDPAARQLPKPSMSVAGRRPVAKRP